MAHRDAIVRYLDDTLEAAGYRDHLPLGLQVIGADDVTHVCTAVSASLDVFERTAAAGAQMLIVHHGLFWNSDPRRIGPRQKERLRSLFDSDLSLVAYHLALDAHPQDGNNALICDALELSDRQGFGGGGERTIGFIGTAKPSISPDRLLALVRAAPPTCSTRPPMPAPTRSSPASRTSRRWHAPGRPESTLSPPATTPPRCSGCRLWESWCHANLGSSTASSTSPTGCSQC